MIEISKIDFKKYPDQLVPAVVQDSLTSKVLMLGFMNEEALSKTLETGQVTFFSRSKSRLWTKGETSGNFLQLKEIRIDCDNDTLLVSALPLGPVCHTGTPTCFDGEKPQETADLAFLSQLEEIIKDRQSASPDSSYTAKLFKKGTAAIAQKVGEEAVEVVIEALQDDKDSLIEESADLLFHFFVLLRDRGQDFSDVVAVLKERNS